MNEDFDDVYWLSRKSLEQLDEVQCKFLFWWKLSRSQGEEVSSRRQMMPNFLFNKKCNFQCKKHKHSWMQQLLINNLPKWKEMHENNKKTNIMAK